MTEPKLQFLRIHHWFIHTETGVIDGDAEHRRLAHLPLQVLLMLVDHAGDTLSKQQILDEVWQGKVVGEEVLTVAISHIRKAMEEGGERTDLIKTVSGKGYRFIATDFAFTSEKRQQNNGLKRLPIVGGVVLLILLSVGFWQLVQTGKETAQLTEQQREALQKSRFLITINGQTEREKALSILTPILLQNPQQPEVLKSWLELQLQIAYAGEKSWQIQAGQLIPMIKTVLRHEPDSVFYFYLAELEFKGNWNFAAAREAFEQALNLESDNGHASFAYAQFLLSQGDFEKALELTRHYIDLFPEAYSKPIVVWIYNMMQSYPLAMKELTALEEYSDDTPGYWISAQITYENSGDHQRAFVYFKKLLAYKGYSEQELHLLDSTFQRDGLAGVYHWLLHVKKERRNIGQYRPPLSWARYAVKSDESELALALLKQAFAQKQYEVLWLGVDPAWQPLHHSAEFNQLLKEHSIPLYSGGSGQSL